MDTDLVLAISVSVIVIVIIIIGFICVTCELCRPERKINDETIYENIS